MSRKWLLSIGILMMLGAAGCGNGGRLQGSDGQGEVKESIENIRVSKDSVQDGEKENNGNANGAKTSITAELNEEQKRDVELIHAYEKAINEGNTKEYISLFCSEIRKEMNDYIERTGDEDFIQEKVEILSIAALKDSYIEERSSSFGDAMGYEGYSVYYVAQKVDFGENADDGVKRNGEKKDLFLIVVENGERYLYRVSATEEIGEENWSMLEN